MLAAEKYYGEIGLCSSCNNSAQCVFRKKRGCDAIYCETFDNLNGGHAPRHGEIILEDLTASGGSAQITILGLCANCENHQTCHLTRPEEGVWHCEEYR